MLVSRRYASVRETPFARLFYRAWRRQSDRRRQSLGGNASRATFCTRPRSARAFLGAAQIPYTIQGRQPAVPGESIQPRRQLRPGRRYWGDGIGLRRSNIAETCFEVYIEMYIVASHPSSSNQCGWSMRQHRLDQSALPGNPAERPLDGPDVIFAEHTRRGDPAGRRFASPLRTARRLNDVVGSAGFGQRLVEGIAR